MCKIVNAVSTGVIFIVILESASQLLAAVGGGRKKAVHMALCIVPKASRVWEDPYNVSGGSSKACFCFCKVSGDFGVY